MQYLTIGYKSLEAAMKLTVGIVWPLSLILGKQVLCFNLILGLTFPARMTLIFLCYSPKETKEVIPYSK